MFKRKRKISIDKFNSEGYPLSPKEIEIEEWREEQARKIQIAKEKQAKREYIYSLFAEDKNITSEKEKRLNRSIFRKVLGKIKTEIDTLFSLIDDLNSDHPPVKLYITLNIFNLIILMMTAYQTNLMDNNKWNGFGDMFERIGDYIFNLPLNLWNEIVTLFSKLL